MLNRAGDAPQAERRQSAVKTRKKRCKDLLQNILCKIQSVSCGKRDSVSKGEARFGGGARLVKKTAFKL